MPKSFWGITLVAGLVLISLVVVLYYTSIDWVSRACSYYEEEWFGRGYTRLPLCKMVVNNCIKACRDSLSNNTLLEDRCLIDGLKYYPDITAWSCVMPDDESAYECQNVINGSSKNIIYLDEECELVRIEYEMN